MNEKGYKLRLDNKWIAVRRCCGDYIYFSCDDENDPNVSFNLSFDMAKRIKAFCRIKELHDKIEIVERGILTEEEKEMSMRQYLTKKRIRNHTGQ